MGLRRWGGQGRGFLGAHLLPSGTSSCSGYSSLLDRMFSALPEGTVLLNKAVRTIRWRGSFHEEGDEARDFPVRVECEDGDAFLADHVIVTVPLGEDTKGFHCPACPLQPVGVVGDGQVEGRDLPKPLPTLFHAEEAGKGFGEGKVSQTPFQSPVNRAAPSSACRFPQGTPPGLLPASPARAESRGHSPAGFWHQQQDLPGVRAAFLGTPAAAPGSGVGG